MGQGIGDCIKYNEDFDRYLEDILQSYDALEALGSVDIPIDITNEQDFIKWIKSDDTY